MWCKKPWVVLQEGGPVRARHKFVERKNFMPEPVPPPEPGLTLEKHSEVADLHGM